MGSTLLWGSCQAWWSRARERGKHASNHLRCKRSEAFLSAGNPTCCARSSVMKDSFSRANTACCTTETFWKSSYPNLTTRIPHRCSVMTSRLKSHNQRSWSIYINQLLCCMQSQEIGASALSFMTESAWQILHARIRTEMHIVVGSVWSKCVCLH